jgi:hypothetical protein
MFIINIIFHFERCVVPAGAHEIHRHDRAHHYAVPYAEVFQADSLRGLLR